MTRELADALIDWLPCIICVIFGLFFVVLTYVALIQSKIEGRFISGFPAFGGVAIFLGFIFSPIKWLAVLCLIDYGIWMLPIALIKNVIYDKQQSKKNKKEYHMRVLVFIGSPRKNGDTATLTKPFIERLESKGAQVTTINLYDKNIAPCVECFQCQEKIGEYGCSIHDDMYEIADEILKADCIILATPIYIWYCTAPMKAMLDRCYGLHKYYGKQYGGSMLESKKCGIIATCGYDPAYGISPFEDGMKRFCEHFKMEYIGKTAVQKRAGDDVERFETPESVKTATDFADIVYARCTEKMVKKEEC